VPHPADLRAGKGKIPELSYFETFSYLLPGHEALMELKAREKKAVQNVLRPHFQMETGPHGNNDLIFKMPVIGRIYGAVLTGLSDVPFKHAPLDEHFLVSEGACIVRAGPGTTSHQGDEEQSSRKFKQGHVHCQNPKKRKPKSTYTTSAGMKSPRNRGEN
jgi:hypothetical protein